MGHDHEGRAEAALQLLELRLRLLPELAVECAERLVEKEEARAARERAGQRDALPLAAGDLGDGAPAEALEPDEAQEFGDTRLALRTPDARPPEP